MWVVRLPMKTIIISLTVFFIIYHVLFGGIRIISDLRYPNGRNDSVIEASGEKLRTAVVSDENDPLVWKLIDARAEDPKHPIVLDNNIYAVRSAMGFFYQYDALYAYGRNGFWIIEANPFHIYFLRNKDITDTESRRLDEIIAEYNGSSRQFDIIPRKEYIVGRDRLRYNEVVEKAEPRIKQLKEKGLYP